MSALILVCIWVWMFTSGVLGLNVYLCPILFSDVPVCVFSEMSWVSWPNSCEYVCFEGPFLLFAFVSVDNMLLAVRLQSTAFPTEIVKAIPVLTQFSVTLIKH